MQVAFGQSKYYSDNLSQNVRRGIRQKLRRGEWTGLAPFGYVNNILFFLRKNKSILNFYFSYSKNKMQVAFGQSKYYSDNLSQNVRRGFRQKLRRGEWPGLAPFGYVNNILFFLRKNKSILNFYFSYSKNKRRVGKRSMFINIKFFEKT